MSSTEMRTACPDCHSSNNVNWFRNDRDELVSRCLTPSCSYRHKGNIQSDINRHQVRPDININQDLLTTGRYESLYDRGISEETCRKYLVQVGELHGKPIHIYNYLNKDGSIVAQKIRFTQTKEFIWRGKNESLFGKQWDVSKLENNSNTVSRIYICEGELDCLSLLQLGFNSVSISTGAGDQTIGEIKKYLDFLEQFEKVVLVFDNDKVGQTTARGVAEFFTPGKCYILSLKDFKDPNDYLKAGKEQDLINELQTEGIKFEPECIVKPEFVSIFVPDAPRHKLSPPMLQEYVRGINTEEGELWLIGAGAKAGKTTICKEIFIKDLIESTKDLNIGVCSAEESVKKAIQSLIAMDHNVPVQAFKEDISLISEEQAEKSYDKYIKSNRVKYVDVSKMELDSKEIISTIRHLVVGNECKFIILDPIHMFIYDMDSKAGERKDIEKFLKRIVHLTRQLKFTILCVCHLSRADQGKDYCEGRTITMRDFKGTAAFEQLCDVMLAIERNILDPYEKSKAKLKVLANRITGNAGYVDELYHDLQTGRLTDSSRLFK